MNDNERKWKPIRQMEEYLISDDGQVFSRKRQKKLKTWINDGYLCIKLFSSSGRHPYYIHKLVAIHFVKNPDNKPTVSHIDGDLKNNHFKNLKWTTKYEVATAYVSTAMNQKDMIISELMNRIKELEQARAE